MLLKTNLLAALILFLLIGTTEAQHAKKAPILLPRVALNLELGGGNKGFWVSSGVNYFLKNHWGFGIYGFANEYPCPNKPSDYKEGGGLFNSGKSSFSDENKGFYGTINRQIAIWKFKLMCSAGLSYNWHTAYYFTKDPSARTYWLGWDSNYLFGQTTTKAVGAIGKIGIRMIDLGGGSAFYLHLVANYDRVQPFYGATLDLDASVLKYYK